MPGPGTVAGFSRVRSDSSSKKRVALTKDFSATHQNLVQRFTAGHEKAIATVVAEKLGVDFQWKPRKLVLTEEHLWLTDVEGHADSGGGAGEDYIPLHEILVARHSTLSTENQFAEYFDESDPGTLKHEQGDKMTGKLKHSVSALAASLTPSALAKASANPNSLQTTVLDVTTSETGINCGRRYTFRFEDADTCDFWIEKVNKEAHRRAKEVANLNALQNAQSIAKAIYDSALCQYVVALLIIFNFVLNAIQAEYEPDSLGNTEEGSAIYRTLDIALTCIFAAELLLNMFGHWFWEFVQDGWSMFDFIVVVFSVVSLFIDDIPFFSILRVVRAFRILRVIKRFQSLRRIFNAVIHSIVPVLNALFIAVMVIAIYTIIGVFLFSKDSDEFSSFGRAMYTLFELTAFTVWPKSLPAFVPDADTDRLMGDANVVIFVVSFVAIVSWTMLQVLVAVLLDNFMTATAEDRAQHLIALRAETKSKNMGPFDPLLLTLVEADTEKELVGQIRAIWKVVDVDGTGEASFLQVREGLLKLQLTPRVRLTEEDFSGATEGYALCNEERKLTVEGFQAMLHRQLGVYVQKHLSDASALASPHGEGEAILQGLKLVLMVLAHDRSSADLLGGLRDRGASESVGELEASLVQAWKELTEVRRQQTHQILPELRQLQASSRDILEAVASIGGKVASRLRPGPSGLNAPASNGTAGYGAGGPPDGGRGMGGSGGAVGGGAGEQSWPASPGARGAGVSEAAALLQRQPSLPSRPIGEDPPSSLTLPVGRGPGRSSTVTANLVTTDLRADEHGGIGVC